MGTGLRITRAGAEVVRSSPEVHFSARPAEARRGDMLRRFSLAERGV